MLSCEFFTHVIVIFPQDDAKLEKALVKASKEYSVTENTVKEMINELKNNIWKVNLLFHTKMCEVVTMLCTSTRESLLRKTA